MAVEMIIDSLRRGLLRESRSLILKEKSGERYLPVYLSRPYADAIKIKLLNKESAKPVNFDLLIPGVDVTSCNIESVTITSFINNVFHAELSLKYRNKPQKIDCLASKALTLGVVAETPIFAEEGVLDRAGIDVS